MTEALFLPDLRDHSPLPENGILSRTVHSDDRVKVIQFCFAPGQELSAHSAPVPAMLTFLAGEAELTLGDQTHSAGPGAFAHMPAHLTHAIRAKTETVMLLTMLKS
jgi:quercetin dioxygenase-like cupin family protein